MPNSSASLIIGVGNTFRHDDGVGIWVARRLRKQLSHEAFVLEASGEGGALLDAWQGAESVVLVDAIRSGAVPGTIRRFDATVERIDSIRWCSSHTFGVGEAIEVARALHELPPRLTLYGIEGDNFDLGVGLSTSVIRSAIEVTRIVHNEALASVSFSHR